MGLFDFGKKKRSKSSADPLAWATNKGKRKARKEARKAVKKSTGKAGGGLFDWLFGK